jgi:hypothetical protein
MLCRFVVVSLILIGCSEPALADELVATKPGLICVSSDALAHLTLPDGSSQTAQPNPSPAELALKQSGGCSDITIGTTVSVQAARHNTSIVTYAPPGGQPITAYVPNIDFAPAPANASASSPAVSDASGDNTIDQVVNAPQTPTAQQTPVPQGYSVFQEYAGSYTCPQGQTNVDLKVFSNPNNPGVQYAIFSFGPPGTDLDNHPNGSYLMNGTFNLSPGTLELQPVSWIKEPLFFTMVGMSGSSEDGGTIFSGTINSRGCGNFQISILAAPSSPPGSLNASGSAGITAAKESDGSVPQITDCNGYGAFVQSVPTWQTDSDRSDQVADAYAAILDQYFHVNLRTVSDQTLNNLIAQASACRNIEVSSFGIMPLQQILNGNQYDENVTQGKAAVQENAALIANLPTCDDRATVSEIKNSVANSPAGKTQGLVLLGLTGITDVTGATTDNFGRPDIQMGYRECQANALFNDGEREIDFTLHWFDKSEGLIAYSVTGAVN